jgi:glucose-6-phosphate 1-dehydrogenase
MEPPVTFGADVIRTEKVQVLQSIPPMTPSEVLKNTVRAQYGKGIIDGKEVPAYRDEPGVDKNSTTETFTSWRLFIENWRWAGVPFFLRTGKRLPKRVTEISIVFKRTPHMIFQRSKNFSSSANILTIRIQPDEGISLQINAKNPGYGMNLKPVLLDFLYGESFGEHISDAYERLLLDCMAGDQTLYIRSDSVESAWTIITPIHDAWDQEKLSSIPIYRSGSWGPEESDELIGINKFKWRNP